MIDYLCLPWAWESEDGPSEPFICHLWPSLFLCPPIIVLISKHCEVADLGASIQSKINSFIWKPNLNLTPQ